MNNIEIIDPNHEIRVSENTVRDSAIALDSSVSVLQQQIIEQGLADRVQFDGCNVIMNAGTFTDLFGVYAVGQNRLLDEKTERIDDLKDSLNDNRAMIQDLKGGILDLRDMVSKCKSEDRLANAVKSSNENTAKNQKAIYQKLLNIESSLKNGGSSNDIAAELINIIKLQDEKLDSVVNEVRTLADRAEGLINNNNLFIDFIIHEIKSLAVGYAMKHNPKKGKENPHYKGLTDENIRHYFKECNGNIRKMVSVIKEELNLDYSWGGIDKRARALGLK